MSINKSRQTTVTTSPANNKLRLLTTISFITVGLIGKPTISMVTLHKVQSSAPHGTSKYGLLYQKFVLWCGLSEPSPSITYITSYPIHTPSTIHRQKAKFLFPSPYISMKLIIINVRWPTITITTLT